MPVLSLTDMTLSAANPSMAGNDKAAEFRYEYMVTHRRNEAFTAREDFMIRLDELQRRSATTHVRIAICGLGGVGYALFYYPYLAHSDC